MSVYLSNCKGYIYIKVKIGFLLILFFEIVNDQYFNSYLYSLTSLSFNNLAADLCIINFLILQLQIINLKSVK